MSNDQGDVERKNKRKKNEEESLEVSDKSITDLINNLNTDCLVEIFQYLPIRQRIVDIPLVCKRWRDVTELAWHDIKTLKFTKHNSSNKFGWRNQKNVETILKKCGHHLTKLTIFSDDCDTKVLTMIEQYCENLKGLVIRDLNSKNWIELFPYLPKLEFFGIRMTSGKCPENFFNALPYKTLTHLHLFTAPNYPDFFRADLFGNLTRLRGLTLTSTTLESHVIEIISQNSHLTSLNIRACSLRGDITLLTALTNLESLTLRSIRSVDDRFLIQLSDKCKHLKYLRISGSQSLSDIGVTSLHKLPQLEELVLDSNTNITHRPLSTMYNLKRLECRYCQCVEEEGIIELMRHSPNLKDLYVSFFDVSNNLITEAHDIAKRITDNIPFQLTIDNLTERRKNLLKYVYISRQLHIKLTTLLVIFPIVIDNN